MRQPFLNWMLGLKYLLVIVTLCVSSAWAAVDVDVYKDRVVIAQQATSLEQDNAVQEAFKRVLVRVTGVSNTLQNEIIAAELPKASRYLSTFGFEPSSEFFSNVLGEKIPTKAMTMEFDSKAINALLLRNGQPVWGTKRPEILLWVADRLNNRERILSSSDESTIALSLAEQANVRGVPIVLPIMDLTDTLGLSFSDVYGLFSTNIERASERYSPDAIMAGRILTSGQQYKADWMIIFKGERVRLPVVGTSEASVIEAGVDFLAQRLSEHYALVSDPNVRGSLSLKIVDVPNLKTFAVLESYLNSVNLITQVSAQVFKGDDVTFNVVISGDQTQLRDVLALDGQLIPVRETSLADQLDNELVFRWRSQ